METMTPPAPPLTDTACWICKAHSKTPFKKSNLGGTVNSKDFQITDSNYGVTGELIRCTECGFIQTTSFSSVLSFYEKMEDHTYEATRLERQIQARELLLRLKPYAPKGRLLDIGAGSGILLEEALNLGYQAEGIDPSDWLTQQGRKRGFIVHEGVLPHPQANGPYDVATLIDVIEHVSNPMDVLKEIRKVLSPNGYLFVVTPDVSSIAAHLLGKRWWHFRIAHIGYFNKSNLDLALVKAGFQKKLVFRPSWYFPADYLFIRLKKYLPFLKHIQPGAFLKKILIPLNLFDSIGAIYQVGPL